ncbi:M20 family metallopeptidase [Methanopyrus sp.]
MDVRERVVRLLCDYISIPSVSGEEEELSERYASDLERAGLEVDIDRLGNVIGRRGEPGVCLTSHLDTVPPGGMERPFEPRIINGKLYGRGACDAKANLAVYATLAEIWDGPLEIVAVVREETDSAGIRHVLRHGEIQADHVINGEPTELRPVIGHKSRVEVMLRIKGEPKHAGSYNPDNPILKFCKVLHDLRERLEGFEDALGTSTVNPTSVQSEGIATNVTPQCLDAVLDVRLNTRLSPEDLERFFHEVKGVSTNIRAGAPPFVLSGDEPVVRALREALSAHGLPDEPITWPASTDAGYIRNLGGKDVVVFGPGSIDHAHSSSEHVPIEELVDAVRVLYDVVEHLSSQRV